MLCEPQENTCFFGLKQYKVKKNIKTNDLDIKNQY